MPCRFHLPDHNPGHHQHATAPCLIFHLNNVRTVQKVSQQHTTGAFSHVWQLSPDLGRRVHVNSRRHESCQVPSSTAAMACTWRGRNKKLNEGGISDWRIRKILQRFIHKNHCHILFICDRVTFAKTIGPMTMSHESDDQLWNVSSSVLEWTDPLAQCRNEGGGWLSVTQRHTGWTIPLTFDSGWTCNYTSPLVTERLSSQECRWKGN